MKGAQVTVIIINYNSGALLERCLDCLSNQTLKPDQIMVIDNNSHDDSTECVDQYLDAKLRRTDINVGFAAANNLALHDCSTEFVALLNPDAFPEKDWLQRLYEAANSRPEVAAFGSRQMIDESPHCLDGIGDKYHISGLVWRDGYRCTQEGIGLSSREIFSPCAAAALYRRDAIVQVGGFDEGYFCYVEDVDLGFRLRLAGYKAMYIPNAVVHHVGSATTGGQHSDFAIYHGHRNLVWTFVKDMPGILFWLLLPLHLALNVASIIWFALRGRGGVILRAKRDALLGLPKMWRKRKHIQKNRVASIGEVWKQLDKRMIFLLSPLQNRYEP